MITPTIQTQPVRITAKVTAADLATLIGAVAASNVLPADLGGGKTLADVANLGLTVLPHALPDGTVAIINAQIK